MKTENAKTTLHRELNFLLAFILSDKFCALFCPVFKSAYFSNSDYRIIFSYAKGFFEKYARPPRKLVVSYMEKNMTKMQDGSLHKSLRKTLITAAESTDELLEKYNSQYIIDDAELFIKTAELKNAVGNMQAAFDNEDDEKALGEYRRLVIPEVQRSNIITFEDDLDKQREALNRDKTMLVQFPDQIGALVGPLNRGDFFTWIAPTSTGKTWFLLWTAHMCRRAGLNVLFLSLEMQEQSVLRRLMQMYYRRVLHGKEDGEKVRIAKLVKDDDGKYKVVHKNIDARKLAAGDIETLRGKAMGKFPRGRLKIACRSGITIGDLNATLSELKHQSNFAPDVIALDYADKMTTSKKVSSEREALGIIWKSLRDLALERNILVATASQTNRAAWDKHFSRESVAEDSRKLNEVSCAIGIMADRNDRENGLLMLRQLKTRDGWFERRDVYCSASFNIGQPVLQCAWAEDLVLPDAKPEKITSARRSSGRNRGLRK